MRVCDKEGYEILRGMHTSPKVVTERMLHITKWRLPPPLPTIPADEAGVAAAEQVGGTRRR